MVRVLQPWRANIRTRQVKSPKVYIRDSGVLHSFLEIASMSDLDRHPKIGASWEGFLLEAVIHALRAGAEQCYFWATHTDAELDQPIARTLTASLRSLPKMPSPQFASTTAGIQRPACELYDPPVSCMTRL